MWRRAGECSPRSRCRGDSADDAGLRQINRELIVALGLVRGVAHAEFIQAHADGHFYFLECAARVGGAYINEMVEAATGINLWRGGGRILMGGGGGSYKLPPIHEGDAGGVVLLARQEGTGKFGGKQPEEVCGINKHHH